MVDKANHFLKGLSLMLLVNLIVKPLWILVIDPAVQTAVGNYDYGVYYSTLNFVLMGNMLLDFGLSNTWLANGTHNNISKAQIIKIKFIFSSIYLAFVVVLAAIMGVPSFALLLPLALLQIANSFLSLCRYFLQSAGNYKVDSALSVMDRVLSAVVIIAILLFPKIFSNLSTITYAYTQALSVYLSIGLIGFIYLPKDFSNSLLDWAKLKLVIQSALPYAMVILLMAILMRADVFFIKWLHPNAYTEVAEYAYGFRLLDALNNFGYLIASYAFVFFVKHINDKTAIVKTSTYIACFLVVGGLAAVAIVYFFGSEIAQLLYKQQTDKIISTMLWCTIAFVGCGIVHVYSSLLTAAKAFKALFIILILSIVTMVVLHLMFTQTYGAIAAAYITAAVQLFFGVGCFVICKLKRLV